MYVSIHPCTYHQSSIYIFINPAIYSTYMYIDQSTFYPVICLSSIIYLSIYLYINYPIKKFDRLSIYPSIHLYYKGGVEKIWNYFYICSCMHCKDKGVNGVVELRNWLTSTGHVGPDPHASSHAPRPVHPLLPGREAVLALILQHAPQGVRHPPRHAGPVLGVVDPGWKAALVFLWTGTKSIFYDC